MFKSVSDISKKIVLTAVVFSFLFLPNTLYGWQDVIKPNIIIFYLDDMGYGQPTSYGGKLIETPNIDKLDREALYWIFGTQYAIRKDNWKLVKALQTQDAPILINLESDPEEQVDLSDQYPEIKKQLQGDWDNWNAKMLPPRWEDKRWNRDEVIR